LEKHKTLWKRQKNFTIIADGTETINEYFACLIVLDSKGNDCFEENNPYKEKILNLFLTQMIKVQPKYIDYTIFREKNHQNRYNLLYISLGILYTYYNRSLLFRLERQNKW
jgi:hypothetical protein